MRSSVCWVTDATTDLQPPLECALLKGAYRKAGLTVADLAAATELSVGTIHIALNGVRYRDGAARVAVPPDRTLVKLATVLRLGPQALRAVGRDRAADLIEEAQATDAEPASFASDAEARAAATARAALVRQVLAAFTTEELRAELGRRDRVESEGAPEWEMGAR